MTSTLSQTEQSSLTTFVFFFEAHDWRSNGLYGISVKLWQHSSSSNGGEDREEFNLVIPETAFARTFLRSVLSLLSTDLDVDRETAAEVAKQLAHFLIKKEDEVIEDDGEAESRSAALAAKAAAAHSRGASPSSPSAPTVECDRGRKRKGEGGGGKGKSVTNAMGEGTVAAMMTPPPLLPPNAAMADDDKNEENNNYDDVDREIERILRDLEENNGPDNHNSISSVRSVSPGAASVLSFYEDGMPSVRCPSIRLPLPFEDSDYFSTSPSSSSSSFPASPASSTTSSTSSSSSSGRTYARGQAPRQRGLYDRKEGVVVTADQFKTRNSFSSSKRTQGAQATFVPYSVLRARQAGAAATTTEKAQSGKQVRVIAALKE